MRQQTGPSKEPAEEVVQDIRRATRKHYSAEEKIRIVLEGLRGEDSIAELCCREGDKAGLSFAGCLLLLSVFRGKSGGVHAMGRIASVTTQVCRFS
jgi:hypothetical protein